ncbi:MAG TPA: methyltransferase [Candidatus Bathyarchaeia archaeon]|nr:methyltransferase [Candidatus Bathyarchaeia archaeon]
MSDNPSRLPGEILFGIGSASRNVQALYVVAKLGVADHMTGDPTDSIQLASKVGADPMALFRVMRSLAALGVFTQDSSDRFGLTPVSQLLRTDNPESMRDVAIYFGEEPYRAAAELLHTVMTGETAFNHVYGKGHFDYLAEHPEASKTFNAFMTQSARRFGRPLEHVNLDGKHLIVDVGGGRGTILAHILRTNPELKGILYDLPHGVAEAGSFLKENGVADRCKIITGSFFDSVPEGGDVYLLSRILHDWPDETAQLILANCRKAISHNGTLLIREAVIPEGDTPSPGKQTDLQMLIMLGGTERSEPEWRQLLKKSKFELKTLTKTGGPFDLIYADPI